MFRILIIALVKFYMCHALSFPSSNDLPVVVWDFDDKLADHAVRSSSFLV